MEEIYCFGGNPLDRAAERRQDTGWIRSLLDDPAARLLPLRELKPAVRRDGPFGAPSLGWQPAGTWRETIETGATLIFLGLDDDHRPYFAIDATDAPPSGEEEPDDARTLAPLLPAGEAAILAEARSLIDWHVRHRFCAQCGVPPRVMSAGWALRCPACQASQYPRTDPVVIMLAVRGQYGLLGRHPPRPGGRFSCL